MSEKKTRIVTVRVSEHVHSRIIEIAKGERRSLANVAMLLLEQGLDCYESPR